MGNVDLGQLKGNEIRALTDRTDAAACARLRDALSYYSAPEWALSYFAVGPFYVVRVSRTPGTKRGSGGEFMPVIFFDSVFHPLKAFSS